MTLLIFIALYFAGIPEYIRRGPSRSCKNNESDDPGGCESSELASVRFCIIEIPFALCGQITNEYFWCIVTLLWNSSSNSFSKQLLFLPSQIVKFCCAIADHSWCIHSNSPTSSSFFDVSHSTRYEEAEKLRSIFGDKDKKTV